MVKFGHLVAAAALVMATTPAFAASTTVSGADKDFARKAAEAGLAEVQMGQLAAQKAQSPDVKQFGQHMVDDHTAANNQLMQIAQTDKITLPTKLSAKDQKEFDRLKKLDGATFDREYIKSQVAAHGAVQQWMQQESNNGKNTDLVGFAQKTLPIIQQHQQMAQGLSQQINGAPKG